MMINSNFSRALVFFTIFTCGFPYVAEAQSVPLADSVRRLLDDDITSADEQRELAIFHGVWKELEGFTLQEQAMVSLLSYDLNNPTLSMEATPALIRAKAALLRGEADKAITLLEGDNSLQSREIMAEALEQLGKISEAVALLKPIRTQLQFHEMQGAPDITSATNMLLQLARLEGRPASDYKLAMDMYARARDVENDPRYWPAMLAEAGLLMEKGNPEEANAAIFDTLSFNPSCGEAWYLVAKRAADVFDFERAGSCVAQLRKINAKHPLALLAEARIYLKQRDHEKAGEVLGDLLKLFPQHREALALQAAAAALTFDEAKLQAALEKFDQATPGGALAYFEVGVYLSLYRQYEAAENMLRKAIERQPNWADPHVELGLLLMQAGDEKGAEVALRHAVRLDEFHYQAGNQLHLVEALLDYEQIETEHFVIKYKDGIDAVLARDMALHIEDIYDYVTTTFDHQPANKTLIEIMPDEKWFGVRITGMPDIWTIAACTGDVISLTPPRSGARQRGTYYWYNVIQHEFAHTVTLDQTANRLPHWFTEGAAVSQEVTGRTFDSASLLAEACHNDRLFPIDQINWGFIRPRQPADRSLAYAQANWMLEYIAKTHGQDRIVMMLRMFREGKSDVAAIEAATGQSSEEFFSAFKQWAGQEIDAWGLSRQQPIKGVTDEPTVVMNMSDEAVAELLESHPGHRELLRLVADRAVKNSDTETARQAVLRYAAACPIDPWSYRQLVQLSAKTNQPEEVLTALRELDRVENIHGKWAFQAAQMYERTGQYEEAARMAMRALFREPYNGIYRELAAKAELLNGNLDHALHHLENMTYLEPTRAIHYTRLAALYHKLNRFEDASNAAEKALELNPDAPVQAFLTEAETMEENNGQNGEAVETESP